MALANFSDILDHFKTELEGKGYHLIPDSFDLSNVSDADLDKAFVLLPGDASPSDMSVRHIDEELVVEIAFRPPPRGVDMAKAISAARLSLVWHFKDKANWGPVDRIQWRGSSVEEWDKDIFILRITYLVSYPGLMKAVNA